jgi:hypothetical protein
VVNRRCAVGTVAMKEGGRCRHASTRQHEHDRGEHRAIVDRCAATALRSDGELRDQGSTISHKASGTKRNGKSITTSHVMSHKSLHPHETRP